MKQFNMLTIWNTKVPQQKPCKIKLDISYKFVYPIICDTLFFLVSLENIDISILPLLTWVIGIPVDKKAYVL